MSTGDPSSNRILAKIGGFPVLDGGLSGGAWVRFGSSRAQNRFLREIWCIMLLSRALWPLSGRILPGRAHRLPGERASWGRARLSIHTIVAGPAQESSGMESTARDSYGSCDGDAKNIK